MCLFVEFFASCQFRSLKYPLRYFYKGISCHEITLCRIVLLLFEDSFSSVSSCSRNRIRQARLWNYSRLFFIHATYFIMINVQWLSRIRSTYELLFIFVSSIKPFISICGLVLVFLSHEYDEQRLLYKLTK